MTSRDRACAVLAATAVATAIFAIGGATRWAQALVAVGAAASLVPLIWSRRVFQRVSPLLALIAIAIVLTAVQLVPLPHGLIAWLDPTGAALRDDGAALAGTSPASTISLDVPATLSALVFFVILLAIAVVALRLSTSESGRYRVLATVAALCGLAALVAGLHDLFGAKSLYGVYQPLQAGPRTIAPLLSNNHFASLMAIGTVVSLGLAMYRRQAPWLRALWLIVMSACALALLNTWSRGGAIAVGLGAFVALATLVGQRLIAHDTPRRRRAATLTSALPIGVVAACTVVVVLYAGAGGVAQQLSQTSLEELHTPRSKFAAWGSATALIDESPWVGIGRGALEPVFTRVHPASAYLTFSHLENEYLQAVVDWGVPGALLMGIAALWLLVAAVRRWRDGPLTAGSLGALSVVLLHSNVDFGVELLGIAAPITAVAATLVYVPLGEREGRRLSVARGVRGIHVVALLAGAALLLSNATASVQDDRLTLNELKSPSFDDLRPALQRHPFDFYNYERAAQIMIREHDPRAIRFLNHALMLHPTASALHLLTAQLLYETHHPDQATIEYAAALSPMKDKARLLSEIASRFPPETAAAAIPSDPTQIDELAPILTELKLDDIQVAWLGRILDQQPHSVHACELLYRIAIRKTDAALVSLASRRCDAYQPNLEDRLALAKVLLTKHSEAEVLHLLGDVETWAGRSDEKAEAWLVLCDAQAALDKLDDAKRCLRRLDASALLPIERAPEIAKRLEHIQELRVAAPKL